MMRTLVIMCIALAFLSCERISLFEKRIKIKGQISRDSKFSGARISSLSLQDAAKVLIFYGNEYELVKIKDDGAFSGKVPLGSATVLAFLTNNNEFIGNLYMKGLNFLPLTGVDESISVIDLSTLTQDSTRIIPANDPIGNQIQLSQAEIDFIKDVGAYYEALAKNLDMNNDNTIDILQDAHIEINTTQNFHVGIWGLNGTPPQADSSSTFQFNFMIHMVGPKGLLSSTNNSLAENASVTGPILNPHSDIINGENSYINNKEFKLNFKRNTNPTWLPFNPGEYKLNIDNKDFTFHYSNINMVNHVILIMPTLHTNASNEVTSISLEYRFPDGSIVDPRKLMITDIMVQIGNSSSQLLEIRHEDGIPSSSYDYYNISLPTPISYSSMSGMNLNYFDLFGNEVVNNWTKN